MYDLQQSVIYMSEYSVSSDKECQNFKHKHKIQLCRAYSDMGYCPYGTFCMFAHGVQQLILNQPAIRVKKCRNFHTHGYCRFGQRCNFRHEKNSRARKKKTKYNFHRIFNGYPDLILGVRMQLKAEQYDRKCTQSSQSSLQ